jgi:hypothetical protein
MHGTSTYTLAAIIAYVYIGAVILTTVGLLSYWRCCMQENIDSQQDRVVMLTAGIQDEEDDTSV